MGFITLFHNFGCQVQKLFLYYLRKQKQWFEIERKVTMKNKNAAELHNLAKNLKAAAVKVQKSVVSRRKAYRVKGWCGRHSGLPTDTKWEKVHYGVFDAVKRDRGDNRAVVAAVFQMKKSVI